MSNQSMRRRSGVLFGVAMIAIASPFSLSDRLSAQDAARPAAGDPFAVTGASPKELLEFIDRIKRIEPPSTERETIVAHLVKMNAAIVAAVDKIGAGGGEAEQTQAIEEKLTALQLLRRLEAPDADKRMKDYLQTLLADKRTFVPPLARIYHLATELSALDRGNHAAVEKLIAEVREHVKSAKPDERNFSVAFQAARAAEEAGLTKLAGEAYVEFAAAFALSDDPKVAENAKWLAGAARLLLLPGNAIDIKGSTLDGKPFDWKPYEGKFVLVDFWATWCGPCVAEMPTLRDCYEKYHDRGFEVVGISLDTDKQRLKDFVEREDIDWTVLFNDDPKAQQWSNPLAMHYGIISIPRAILVDRAGKVISLNAHGDALWDLLAEKIGPPVVKKPEVEATPPAQGAPKVEKPAEKPAAKPADK